MMHVPVNLGRLVSKRLLLWVGALAMSMLAACSSTPDKPNPTALTPFTSQRTVTPVWSVQVGPIGAMLSMNSTSGRLALVSQNGMVSVINADTGALAWQHALNTPISAGIGGDGQRYAVVTQANELITLSEGKVVWRSKLPANAFTAPLVAGGRVFVLTTDRTVLAFDGASGQRLWSQQRAGEALVVKQSGILTSFQENLLVGLSGRLVAMSPTNGVSRWEASVGSSRGTNEVERLVDLVSGISRVNNIVCARAYQTAVSCVDATRGNIVWTRSAQGHTGLSGNDGFVFGTESDGKFFAWNRTTGQVAWQTDSLRFRGLTSPSFADGQLLVGDQLGWVHWLDPKNGQTVARVQIDSSGIAIAPLRIGQNWVSVSKNGLVQAHRAE
jgi:outer membrane protein assembly factor BamB